MENFKEIHSFLIKRSDPFPYLNKLIKKNGVQIQKKTDLDLLSFVCKTIVSQQISNKAAMNIWSKIVELSQKGTLNLGELLVKNKLCNVGVSKQKLSCMKEFSSAISEGKLDEAELLTLDSHSLKKKLLLFRGVGEWTVNMIEIFYLMDFNIWPEKDFAIQKMIRIVNSKTKASVKYSKVFSPYLSILALHFWRACD